MELHIKFKNLWAWLAEDPERFRREWPGFTDSPEEHDCPACEYARKKGTGNPKDTCDFCPLTDSAKEVLGKDYDNLECLGGLFVEYCLASSDYRHAVVQGLCDEITSIRRERAVKAAVVIRDLKWKD